MSGDNSSSSDEADQQQRAAMQRLLTLAKIETTIQQPLLNLAKLNLPDCDLSTLPSCLPDVVPNLSILFLSKNKFTTVPAVIGRCPALQMVAFKNNRVERIEPDALQPQMRWLILTDNRLTELPSTIGRCAKLQKLMLSGNALTTLPTEIEHCTNLELVRLASNRLTEPPMTLLQLPNLRWVALSANPFLADTSTKQVNNAADESARLPILDGIDESSIMNNDTTNILGSGAGGVTRKLVLMSDNSNTPVAVKTFGGTMTSDGSPEEERRIACATATLQCPGFVQVLGRTKQTDSLVMEYLDNVRAFADPPSMESCSRDVYPATGDAQPAVFTTHEQAYTFLTTLLDALLQLHTASINHGDFYGHNILVNQHDVTQVKLSDLGASFFYDTDAPYGKLLERIELRAYAVLVDEVKSLLFRSNDSNKEHPSITLLDKLSEQCCTDTSTFERVMIWWKQQQLASMAKAFDGVE